MLPTSPLIYEKMKKFSDIPLSHIAARLQTSRKTTYFDTCSSSSRSNWFLGLLCTQDLRQCKLVAGRFKSATVPAGGSDRALCLGSLPPVGGGGAVRFSANKRMLAELCRNMCCSGKRRHKYDDSKRTAGIL